GTVTDNVGDPGALAAACATDLRPDTQVGEYGGALSGGQRQRVALARALAARRPVLVLHDPTSAVDAVTEARIAESLRRERAGLTTIVVTTSPALLAAADHVAFLDHGHLAAQAPHDDLLRHHPSYRETVLA
ncbi:MAG: ABC transporter ATP-binding protein, partial [Nonomuraea sp.]|nr:ABC transporter ATP-binding protein [Nonomuraea sp.]